MSQDNEEALSAILRRTADLNRWVLRVSQKGRVSNDMRQDMLNACKMIEAQILKIGA